MARLPQVGSDDNTWGEVLNEFLEVSHNADGTIKDQALSTKVGSLNSPSTITNLWAGNQASYDALTPDPNVIYFLI